MTRIHQKSAGQKSSHPTLPHKFKLFEFSNQQKSTKINQSYLISSQPMVDDNRDDDGDIHDVDDEDDGEQCENYEK